VTVSEKERALAKENNLRVLRRLRNPDDQLNIVSGGDLNAYTWRSSSQKIEKDPELIKKVYEEKEKSRYEKA